MDAFRKLSFDMMVEDIDPDKRAEAIRYAGRRIDNVEKVLKYVGIAEQHYNSNLWVEGSYVPGPRMLPRGPEIGHSPGQKAYELLRPYTRECSFVSGIGNDEVNFFSTILLYPTTEARKRRINEFAKEPTSRWPFFDCAWIGDGGTYGDIQTVQSLQDLQFPGTYPNSISDYLRERKSGLASTVPSEIARGADSFSELWLESDLNNVEFAKIQSGAPGKKVTDWQMVASEAAYLAVKVIDYAWESQSGPACLAPKDFQTLYNAFLKMLYGMDVKENIIHWCNNDQQYWQEEAEELLAQKKEDDTFNNVSGMASSEDENESFSDVMNQDND